MDRVRIHSEYTCDYNLWERGMVVWIVAVYRQRESIHSFPQ